MVQMKSVGHIINYLNLSDVTKLNLGENYDTFYNNVCWNQIHEFSSPSEEVYRYLAYKEDCQILSEDELSKFKQMAEKNYSNLDEKRWANLVGRFINYISVQ
jgi:hypothetical protein